MLYISHTHKKLPSNFLCHFIFIDPVRCPYNRNEIVPEWCSSVIARSKICVSFDYFQFNNYYQKFWHMKQQMYTDVKEERSKMIKNINKKLIYMYMPFLLIFMITFLFDSTQQRSDLSDCPTLESFIRITKKIN